MFLWYFKQYHPRIFYAKDICSGSETSDLMGMFHVKSFEGNSLSKFDMLKH